MTVRKVAIVFDNQVRPETTGLYCRRALGSLVEVVHFLAADLARIPRAGFDLYLNVDDGLRYHLPPELKPSAFWAIDTHMDFHWCLEKARGFDHVFAAQRDGADKLRQAGIASALWLPLACDPELHGKRAVPKRYDVCFVGHVFDGPRAELLDLIRKRFPNTFVGQRYFQEMAETYSAARVVFNRSVKNDVNMRVFEALASGSLLMTNDLAANGQAEWFQDGVHLATYKSSEELVDKIAFYLAHEEVRERIAAAGREEAIARHTYRHRMQGLLEQVAGASGGSPRAAPTGQRGPAAAEPEATVQGAPASGPPKPAGPVPAGAPPDFRCPAAEPAAPAKGEAGIAIGSRRGLGRPNPEAHPVPAAPHAGYFGHARPELVALIPPTARAVLDIGCGAGRLGEAVKARQEARVTGIELDRSAANLARGRLDHVLVGDVEQMELPFEPQSFDTVVCADVLEHLHEPGQLLRRIRTWLKPGGWVVASIPNVRHHSVVRGLLAGHWTYEPARLLDRTHLRFFTLREIEKLFYRAGFAVNYMGMVPGPGDDGWQEQAQAGRVNVGRLHIGDLPPGEAEEFYAYQYLIRAEPEAIPDRGLTSIVIATHNELAYTRQCLDSIRQYTDERYELIVVDNGSTDGTPEELATCGALHLIRNADNRGFPAAANQGIRAARGDQVLLLNNDCIVTTGWLRRLLAALHGDPKVGLAGPVSNCVTGEQRIDVTYEDLTGLDGFAHRWGQAHHGQHVDNDRLVGFCLVIRREVIDRIGLLDERFGIGCFEDDDYCLRALAAGYSAVIARDAFVHHFGGCTFIATGLDYRALIEKNKALFLAKWQGAKPSAPAAAPPTPLAEEQPAARYTARAAPGGGLLLERRDILLSLCMIARDNARTIGPALTSTRPYVDEMIVVDTGSTDGTPAIAARLGARVFHFPWCDDFSAARNESLKHARGRMIVWIDSDDTISPENGRKLRELAARPPEPNVLGYVLQVHCPGPGDDGQADVTVVDHVKLFPNRPDLRFEGRIHEQLLPAIRRAGGDVAFTDIFLTHTGYDHSPEGQKKKLERDLRILGKELAERPEHPFTLFNLGMTYADAKDFPRSVDSLRRSAARSGPDESQLRKTFALLVYCLGQLGKSDEAWEASEQGLNLFPDDAELRFRRAILLQEQGRLGEALAAYEDVIGRRAARHFSSVVQGITGFKARHNMAIVLADTGELARAEAEWRRVVDEVPGYMPGWRGLGDILLRQGRHNDARALAKRLGTDPRLRREGLLLQGHTETACQDFDSARRTLEQAVKEFPDDADVRQALGRFLFEHGDVPSAEAALKALVERAPQDAAAHHNLGTLYLRTARHGAAADAYRESLRHRPDSAVTCVHLGYALKDGGDLGQAVAVWRKALDLAPGHPAATEALRLAQAL
jgi:GT2 family glycosyltransferase/tetratricopeptide (TPR) repeat protein/SAM-dependent methyltransferase